MASDKWQSYEEDEFEELLRDAAPESEEMLREIDEWNARMDGDVEDIDDADEGPDAIRLPDVGPVLVDPTRWLPGAFMSRTETCLRVARHLLVSGIAAADIHVSLDGYELTRRRQPHFPAARFLGERGLVRRQSTTTTHEWCGEYASNDWPHVVHLVDATHSRVDAADLVTTLADGRRLLVHATRGSLHETRSSGEHKVLRAVIGRALTFEGYRPTDIPAVAIPRSGRFHRLASSWRDSLLVQRATLQILTVDRAGNVNGLMIGQ